MAGFFDGIGRRYDQANQALMQRLAEDAIARERQVRRADLTDMRARLQGAKGEQDYRGLAEELYAGLGEDYGMNVADYETALQGRASGNPVIGAGVGQYLRDKAAATAEGDWRRRFLDAASQDTAGGVAIRAGGITAAAGGVTAGLTAAGQGLMALMGYLQQGQEAQQERERPLA